MAKRVVVGATFILNSVDYSTSVANSELALEGPEVDVTTYSASGWQEFLQGLKGGQLTVEFNKDSEMTIDLALWNLFTSATGTSTFEVRPKLAAVGATNPKFTGTVVINSHNVGPGQVGSKYGASHTWRVTGAVTRAEA